MAVNILNAKIVDLHASKFDKEKSDKTTGHYIFEKKIYIDYSGTRAPRPNFKFSWCTDNPGSIEEWRMKWPGADYVTTEDQYWPEGVHPKDGHYKIQDAVLMKVPLLEYLGQRREEIRRSEQSTASIMDSYRSECGNFGLTEGEVSTYLQGR